MVDALYKIILYASYVSNYYKWKCEIN